MSVKKRLGIIFIVLLIIQVLFDPLSTMLNVGESLQASIDLPLARSRWEAQSIAHYQLDVSIGTMACIPRWNIEVKNGVVLRVGPRSDFTEDPWFFDPTHLSFEDSPSICNYKNYVVPVMFDNVGIWLWEEPSSVTQVTFDPTYGFVSSFRYDSCGGQGLLSPKVTDCTGGFSIENFTVLDK